MSFQIDSSGFERDLDQAMREVANEGLQKLKSDILASIEATRLRVKPDESLEEVEAALGAELSSRDLKLPDEHIKAFAEAIQTGRGIDLDIDTV